MNQSVFIFLIGTVLMFSACTNSQVTTKDEKTMNGFEIVYQSEYGGSGQDEVQVIENQGEFAELWVRTTMQPAQSAPHIDFSKKIIVAKHFQSQNSGGTEYDVKSVTQKGNVLEIHYNMKSPSGMATMAITSPMLILAIDKTTASEIKFIPHNIND